MSVLNELLQGHVTAEVLQALARTGGLIWAGVLGLLLALWVWSEAMLGLAGGLRGGARTAVFALLFVLTAVALPLALLALAPHLLPVVAPQP